MTDVRLPEQGIYIKCEEVRSARIGSLTQGEEYEVVMSGPGDGERPNTHPYTGMVMPANLFSVIGDDGMAVLLEGIDTNIALFSIKL